MFYSLLCIFCVHLRAVQSACTFLNLYWTWTSLIIIYLWSSSFQLMCYMTVTLLVIDWIFTSFLNLLISTLPRSCTSLSLRNSSASLLSPSTPFIWAHHLSCVHCNQKCTYLKIPSISLLHILKPIVKPVLALFY